MGGGMILVAVLNAWLGYSFGYYIAEWAIAALMVVLMFLVAVGLGFLGGVKSRTGSFAIALFLCCTS